MGVVCKGVSRVGPTMKQAQGRVGAHTSTAAVATAVAPVRVAVPAQVVAVQPWTTAPPGAPQATTTTARHRHQPPSSATRCGRASRYRCRRRRPRPGSGGGPSRGGGLRRRVLVRRRHRWLPVPVPVAVPFMTWQGGVLGQVPQGKVRRAQAAAVAVRSETAVSPTPRHAAALWPTPLRLVTAWHPPPHTTHTHPTHPHQHPQYKNNIQFVNTVTSSQITSLGFRAQSAKGGTSRRNYHRTTPCACPTPHGPRHPHTPQRPQPAPSRMARAHVCAGGASARFVAAGR